MDGHSDKLDALRLFVTVEHECNYLPSRSARNLVADPEVTDQQIYSQLAKSGFRRSGDHVYRPHCPSCNACQSLRIPVTRFRPNRSQLRTYKRNQDLFVRELNCQFSWEHFRLFQRYLRSRHRNGGMDNTDPDHYFSFIASSWSFTRLYEFRHQQRLVAVAVVDYLDDGLSAVYTFFDPQEAMRGLGTYTILWQIGEAARLGLHWVYLGYWIRDCPKMTYKSNFRPHEIFFQGQWVNQA